MSDKDKLGKDILNHIITLCNGIAWGKTLNEDKLFSYTAEDAAPEDLVNLAESFGLMIVKLNAREEYNSRLIQELQDKNIELKHFSGQIEKRNDKLMEIVQANHSAKRLVGQCDQMQKSIKFALSIAKRPVNTLLLGETGTGKEEFAKLIHFNSPQYNKPFIAVNCSAIPDSLFESEMFGIEKGIATGVNQKKGLIEEANGGTLFLDEVADMPITHQAKLLRVIEEQELVRVGSSKTIPLNIKIISAANIDLEEAVKNGKFRMDLFYRLNVAEITIPPLRERGEDILLLAQKFLDYHCWQMKANKLSLSQETKKALLSYPWPGNVRELNNEMERAVVLTLGKKIEVSDLSPKIQTYTEKFINKDLNQTLKESIKSINHFSTKLKSQENNTVEVTKQLSEFEEDNYNLLEIERSYILQALEKTKGNRSQAAILLGITREGLRKKLLRMNITSPA